MEQARELESAPGRPQPKRSRMTTRSSAKCGLDDNQLIQTPEEPVHEDPPSESVLRSKSNKLKVMLNPWIVDNISHFCRPAELLSLRPTCKTWNSSFLPKLTQKHEPIQLDVSRKHHCGGTFAQDMTTSAQIPFMTYDIKCSTSLHGFGSVCGETVTKLSLHIFGVVRQWNSHPIRRILYEQLPNVTELKLRITEPKRCPWGFGSHACTEDTFSPNLQNQTLAKLKKLSFISADDNYGTSSSSTVLDLIESATALESLELPCPSLNGPGYNGHIAFLISIFTGIRDKNINVSKLKHFQIGEIKAACLAILLDLAGHDHELEQNGNYLRLLTLSATVTAKGCSRNGRVTKLARLFKVFLASQASTLEKLEITVDVEGTTVLIPLVQLDSLQELTISRNTTNNGTDYDLDYEEETNTFTSMLPNLKKYKTFITQDEMDPNLSHPGLTHLSIEGDIAVLSGLSAAKFPAVCYLELNLTEVDKWADEIWTGWPTLKHLRLVVEVKTRWPAKPDSFLTGIHPDRLRELRTKLESVKRPVTLDALRRLSQEYKTRPGISDLTRLEEFHLVWYGAWKSDLEHLTDVFGYLGLALISAPMQRIHINVVSGKPTWSPPPDPFSDSCLTFLQSTFGPGGEISCESQQ